MFTRIQDVVPGAIQTYTAKSALFTTAVGDRGTLFDNTGTYTITLGTTSLTAGWSCWFRNVSGTQTLDPSGAVTINGASTYSLSNAGDIVQVIFDGTNFRVEHTQRPSTVAITGGSIDGTAIGSATKAAGSFTTLATTGTATVGDGTAAAALNINGANATNRDLGWQTAGSIRWRIRVTSNESGSDAGSTWNLSSYNDSGTNIDTPISIIRASGGDVSITRPVNISTASSGLTIAKTTGTTLVVSSTTDATSTTAASTTLAGGLAVAKAIHVGSAVTITHTDDAAGGLILRTSTTDATAKNGRIKIQHYTNAEEPVTALLGIAGNGFNQLSWGGSSGVENAATVHVFYTAATSTTLTGTERMRIDSTGNVSIGTAALATTATDGFLYIPTCAGAPTGVPTAKTGRSPIIYDSTNNKVYVYNGAWKATAALT